MADSVSATDAANLLTFVAPGVAAKAAYDLVYPQPETGQLRGLVTAVVLSLPLVAVIRLLAEEVGIDRDPLDLGFVALLLGASVMAGYAWALVRGTGALKSALGKLGNPGVKGERISDPDPTVLARVLSKLPDGTGVTIGLNDGRKLYGVTHLWSNPLDQNQQLYLIHHQWAEEDGGWGDPATQGGVVLELDHISFLEVSDSPQGLEFSR